MRIKATVRFHFIPDGDGYNKSQAVTHVGEEVERLEWTHVAGGNVNDAAALENSLGLLQMATHRFAV
jgi:hypothetical protein